MSENAIRFYARPSSVGEAFFRANGYALIACLALFFLFAWPLALRRLGQENGPGIVVLIIGVLGILMLLLLPFFAYAWGQSLWFAFRPGRELARLDAGGLYLAVPRHGRFRSVFPPLVLRHIAPWTALSGVHALIGTHFSGEGIIKSMRLTVFRKNARSESFPADFYGEHAIGEMIAALANAAIAGVLPTPEHTPQGTRIRFSGYLLLGVHLALIVLFLHAFMGLIAAENRPPPIPAGVLLGAWAGLCAIALFRPQWLAESIPMDGKK